MLRMSGRITIGQMVIAAIADLEVVRAFASWGVEHEHGRYFYLSRSR